MHKYFLLFQTYWQNSWVYPISFVTWRVRQFLATFASLTVWSVIYEYQAQAFGYTKSTMISYIFLTGFLQSMILATQSSDLAQQIYTGEISNTLVKPVNIFGALLSREFADKLMNFVFTIAETIFLFLIFRPVIFFPNTLMLLIFFLAVFLGAVLLFLIMLVFGTVGFWSPDTWGPRFLFYMFIDFTAGKLYPLNIFPLSVQHIIFLTPFPYLSYVQTQIFLNHYSALDIGRTFGLLLFWITLTYFVFRHFWQKGIKEYGAVGH